METMRLPRRLEPVSYSLEIKVNVPGYPGVSTDDQMTFEGKVVIEIGVRKTTDAICLHSLGLNFTIANCSLAINGKEAKIKKVWSGNFDKVYFDLETDVEEGDVLKLKIAYKGRIDPDLVGFYSTWYTTQDGTKKVAVVSKFEPTDARRMVPCFDEPNFKAKWAVKVVHPTATKAISNGIEISEDKVDDNFKSTSFKTTPKMSSYLLAIFVSEFEYLEKSSKNGVRMRVWARPEAKNYTQYALDVGVTVLDYYEDFFNLTFPLKKQDMVALPDFASGAMENWGLITYRENRLVYDERIYTPMHKFHLGRIIAHEISHQWFGNLVTMQWWDDLWLNEGFATLIQMTGTDVIGNGSYRSDEIFVSNMQSVALQMDSQATSQPLTLSITKPTEIREAFGPIAYQKGASILSMIRKVMGAENFQRGLQVYLERAKYGNANVEDLFVALSETVPEGCLGPDGKKLNIVDFAEPWTAQLGYPIVTVSRTSATQVVLTQRRFKADKMTVEREKYRNPKYKFEWDVPVWYQLNKSDEIRFSWLRRGENLTVECESPTVFNVDSNGFYRVQYDETEWAAIGKQLKRDFAKYSPKTIYRILDDSLAVAHAGLLNYSVPLELMSYLNNETDFIPWLVAWEEFGNLLRMFHDGPENAQLRKYMTKLIEKNYKDSSFEYISDNYKDDQMFKKVELQSMTTKSACWLDDQSCINATMRIFSDDVVDKCNVSDLTSQCSEVAAPLRSRVYCIGVKKGDQEVYDKMFKWYKNERVQLERDNLMNALTCIEDVDALQKLLLNAMSSTASDFRLQDVVQLVVGVVDNVVGSRIALSFLIDNWQHIFNRFRGSRPIGNAVQIFTSSISTQADLDELRKFVETTPTTANIFAFDEAIEAAAIRVEWASRIRQQIVHLFN